MSTPSNSDPQAKSSDEYEVEILADGSLRVVHNLKLRVFYFWLHLFMGFCILAIGIFLAGVGGAHPWKDDGFQWHHVPTDLHDPSQWFLYVFMLMGALSLWIAYSWLACWENWHVTRNLIEVHYYFLRLRYFTHRYTSGRIVLERNERHDSELNNNITGYEWWLCVRTGRRRGILAFSQNGQAIPDDALCSLAELLASQTGWEFSPYTEQPTV